MRWHIYVDASLTAESMDSIHETIKTMAEARADEHGGSLDTGSLIVVPHLPRDAAIEIQVVASADPYELECSSTQLEAALTCQWAVQPKFAVFQGLSSASDPAELSRHVALVVSRARSCLMGVPRVLSAKLYTCKTQFGREQVSQGLHDANCREAVAISVIPTVQVCGFPATSVLYTAVVELELVAPSS